MKVMSSRQRVLTAFEHQEPDHVPCWMGASPEFKALARGYLGLPDDESLAIYIADDFRRVYTRYVGPDNRHPTGSLTYPQATYRTPFGIERYGYGYGMPLHFPLKDARGVAEVDAYPWPDPEWQDVSHMREDALQYERRYAILGGEWSPFWHDAIDLLDFDGLIYRMYDNPEVVDAIMTHVTDYYLEASRRTFEASGDAIDVFFIGNDFGAQTGPMISPRLFRRFILPHLKRLADLGHEYGKYVLLHCDGSIRALIPDMIAIGVDGVQSVQPLCHGMDLTRLKADYGKRLTFAGGIDTQSLIEGSADEAQHLTRQVLEIMMPGGGFIASPSHDYLLPETPVENVIIMYETIKEYGAYS